LTSAAVETGRGQEFTVLIAGRLGLYSEQICGSRDLLGNFSAFTHLV
jgi:hypothetical protein